MGRVGVSYRVGTVVAAGAPPRGSAGTKRVGVDRTSARDERRRQWRTIPNRQQSTRWKAPMRVTARDARRTTRTTTRSTTPRSATGTTRTRPEHVPPRQMRGRPRHAVAPDRVGVGEPPGPRRWGRACDRHAAERGCGPTASPVSQRGSAPTVLCRASWVGGLSRHRLGNKSRVAEPFDDEVLAQQRVEHPGQAQTSPRQPVISDEERSTIEAGGQPARRPDGGIDVEGPNSE